jgi:hypothetical protein
LGGQRLIVAAGDANGRRRKQKFAAAAHLLFQWKPANVVGWLLVPWPAANKKSKILI